MKKKYKILSLLSIIGLTGYNCAPIGHSFFNSGTFITSVKFPDKNFHTQAIPDNTASIVVKVDGSGIAFGDTIFFELTRENPRKIITEVPEGSKKVTAKAYDSEGNFLAMGENTVNVIAKKLNRVEVELKAQTITKPSASASPEPSSLKEQCLVRLDEQDLPISKTLENSILTAGCKIVYPSSMPTSTPIPEATASPTDVLPTSEPTPTSTPSTTGGGGSTFVGKQTGNASATVNVIEQPPSDISSGPITIVVP